jgi:hypothetical protein
MKTGCLSEFGQPSQAAFKLRNLVSRSGLDQYRLNIMRLKAREHPVRYDETWIFTDYWG